MAINCWEFNSCGREPGGANVAELGVCPAASEVSADGLNAGTNGGRICWAIAGTLCKGQVQGTLAAKLASCDECGFFRLVRQEEGSRFLEMLTRVHVYEVGGQEQIEEQEFRSPPFLAPGEDWRVGGSLRKLVGIEFVRDDCRECRCFKVWVR